MENSDGGTERHHMENPDDGTERHHMKNRDDGTMMLLQRGTKETKKTESKG